MVYFKNFLDLRNFVSDENVLKKLKKFNIIPSLFRFQRLAGAIVPSVLWTVTRTCTVDV